ncbi:MAG: hypothetical protein KDK23_06475 [Leptospiraceae bacterium]|nr:hypothetical protein [Leptospiraceae bacterium]
MHNAKMLFRVGYYIGNHIYGLVFLVLASYSLNGCAAFSAMVSEITEVTANEDSLNSDKSGQADSNADADKLEESGDERQERPPSAFSESGRRIENPASPSTLAPRIKNAEEIDLPEIPGLQPVPALFRPFRKKSRSFLIDQSRTTIVRGDNGPGIQIDPSNLELPSACKEYPLRARLWDLDDPLEASFNGLPMTVPSSAVPAGINASLSQNSASEESHDLQDPLISNATEPSPLPGRERRAIMESGGMFYIALDCNGEEVRIKEGASLPLILSEEHDSRYGLYQLEEAGWQGRQPEPAKEPGTTFRVELHPDMPELMPGAWAGLAQEQGGYNIWVGHYVGNGILEAFVEHGQKGMLAVHILGHESQYVPVEGNKDRPLASLEPLKFRKIPEMEGPSGYHILRRVSLEKGLAYPDGLPDGCFFSVQVISGWSDKGGINLNFLAPHVILKVAGTESPSSAEEEATGSLHSPIVLFRNRFDRIGRHCFKRSDLPEEPADLEIEIPEYQVEITKVTVKAVTEPTEITLILKRPPSQYPQTGDVMEYPSIEKQREATASISDLGFWNLDYPRTDLACIKGEVDAGQPYMVSAIAMQRFSQNSTWHNEAQFVIPILKGERFRFLVVAGERAGLSREMVVGERGDPSLLPCVELGTIALKRVPDDARSDPHRFRKYLGM